MKEKMSAEIRARCEPSLMSAIIKWGKDNYLEEDSPVVVRIIIRKFLQEKGYLGGENGK